MSIDSFCIRLVWRLTLYQKREVNALFICKLPKIKVFKEKIGSKLDTTKLKQRIENMKNSTRNAKSVKAAITLLTVGAVFISSTISTCAYHPLNDHTFAFDSEESAEHFLNVPKAQESSPGKANTLSMHRRYFKIPFGNQSDLYKYVHKKNSKGGCTIYKFIVPVCTGCEYHKPYIFDSSVIYARCPH